MKLHKKYKPLFSSDTRYYVVTGGRGSGKSFSVTAFLALLMYEEKHTILFTRLTMTSAHLSIIPEFVAKLEEMGLQDDFEVTKTEISHKATKSKIIFRGIKSSSGDQTASLKSLHGVTTWVMEEAEELQDEETFDKISKSVRQKGTQNRIILLLNPATKEHWIYTRFFVDAGVEPGSNVIKDNTTYIHTTYLDNKKNLDGDYIRESDALKVKNEKKYNRVMLGAWQEAAEGLIYEYKIGAFDESLVPVFGQDYGFHPDPTTLIKVGIDRKAKKIYASECFYRPNLSTSKIAELNISHAGKSLIIADSAEPRLIDEVKAKGVNIRKVVKAPGSVLTGIKLLQDYELIIDPDSPNLIKELNHYAWLDKKSNTPVDGYNHLLDGLRYVVMEMTKPQTSLAKRFG